MSRLGRAVRPERSTVAAVHRREHRHRCAAAGGLSRDRSIARRRAASERKPHVVDAQPGDGDRVHVGAARRRPLRRGGRRRARRARARRRRRARRSRLGRRGGERGSRRDRSGGYVDGPRRRGRHGHPPARRDDRAAARRPLRQRRRLRRGGRQRGGVRRVARAASRRSHSRLPTVGASRSRRVAWAASSGARR